jgi:gas vesicle protein
MPRRHAPCWFCTPEPASGRGIPDKEVSVAKTNGLAFLAVALGAAAVGAAVGVLVAPESGRDTRRKLGRRIEKETEHLRKQGARAIKDFGERAQEAFDDGRERLSQMLHS